MSEAAEAAEAEAGAGEEVAAAQAGKETGAEAQRQAAQAEKANGAEQVTQAAAQEQQVDKAKPQEKASEQEEAFWRDGWRKKMAEHYAAGDEKALNRELKRLARIADPAAIYNSYRELEAWRDQGGFVKVPGENATEKELADYRKALGVPEKPEDYFKDLKLSNGAVIGDADKDMAESYAKALHEVGAPPAMLQAGLDWYYKNQEEQAAALDEADDKFKVEAEQALKEELGPSYKRLVNSIGAVFTNAAGGADLKNEGSLYARLLGGRMADGRLIGDDPDMVRFLVGLAKELHPVATVTEGGHESAAGVDAEIKAIESEWRDPQKRAAYYKDEAKQARYRELLSARAKHQARAA